MARRIHHLPLVIVAAGLVVVIPSASAGETCRDVTTVTVVQGTIRSTVRRECHQTAPAAPSGTGGPAATVELDAELCLGVGAALGTDGSYCSGATTPEPEDGPAPLTGSDVASAFHRLPLPSARLQVQPPNGRTLVNFETNFFTERAPVHRAITLLGRRVQLRVTPASYTWHFGDGTTTSTTGPGRRYPHLDVTHSYAEARGFSPSVDVTYTAVWRTGGGAWQPVPGSVTIEGASVALEAVEARPTLTGYGS